MKRINITLIILFFNIIIFAGEGLEKYEKAKLPAYINGNVYLNGAKSYMKFVEKGRFNPKIKLEDENGRLFLHITYDESIFNLKNKLVTTGLLGKQSLPSSILK